MRASEQMTELLLVGNPNAGKSTTFNKLTGARRMWAIGTA